MDNNFSYCHCYYTHEINVNAINSAFNVIYDAYVNDDYDSFDCYC